jgi:TonB family protein
MRPAIEWIWPLLAGAALKSLIVIGVAWAAAWLLRTRSAAARHVVWTASAAALLALPWLSFTLPAVRLRALNGWLPNDSGAVFRVTSIAGPVSGGARSAGQTRRPVPRSPATAAASPALNPRTVLVVVWLGGVALGLGQILLAYVVLHRLRRTALPSPLQAEADALRAELGVRGPVRVLAAGSALPMTSGTFHPVIVLPADAHQWPAARRRIVLLHELAHVLRGDTATHLMARAALVVQWWNPLAWSAWREFLKERERAADDVVLGAGAVPSEYAGHLLDLARSLQHSTPATAAAVAMARRSQLEGRLMAILNDNIERGRQRRIALAAATLLAIAIIAPLAAIRAQAQTPFELPDVDSTIATAKARKTAQPLDDAAANYELMRKYPEARKLREAALPIVEGAKGTSSSEYTDGLVKLGNLSRLEGRSDSADYYNKALAQGDRPQAFAALIALGRNSLIDARTHTPEGPAKAMEYFTRAKNVAGSGAQLSTALTWIARVSQLNSDGEWDADALYRSAIAAADPDSIEQTIAREFYAAFLKDHGRAADAAPIEAQTRAVRKTRAEALAAHTNAGDGPRRVGGGVTAPSLIFKAEPQYTEEARAAKVSGTVLLKVVIDTDGGAKDIQVMNGLGMGLDEQAVIAVSRWRFKSGMKDGVPVPVQAAIEVNFRLL